MDPKVISSHSEARRHSSAAQEALRAASEPTVPRKSGDTTEPEGRLRDQPADGLSAIRPSKLLYRPEFRAGFRLLLQAHDYARDTKRDLFDFAVEIAELHAVGLNNNDLRWLVCKRYARHADESTYRGASRRTFRSATSPTFCEKTCFVPTNTGVAVAKYLAAHSAKAPPVGTVPHWDPELRELRFGSAIVKRYTRRSPNQEVVLAAFEKEAWTPRIDDPLPPTSDLDPFQRLRDTIKHLNRCHENPLIRFHGDGSGKGIRWIALFKPQAEPI
jgi:hypothetical protein